MGKNGEAKHARSDANEWVPIIGTISNHAKDVRQPTYIGYKIPPNTQKMLKFCI